MEKVELNANTVLGAFQLGIITSNEARVFFGLDPVEEPKPAVEIVKASTK